MVRANIKEWISIAELECVNPAINRTLFPGIPASGEIFSSSPANAGTGTTSVLLLDLSYGLDDYTILKLATSPASAKYFPRAAGAAVDVVQVVVVKEITIR